MLITKEQQEALIRKYIKENYNRDKYLGFMNGVEVILDLITEEDHSGKQNNDDVISCFSSDTFIENVCLSFRHDYGLMAEQDKQRLRFECKEWMRAISNTV